MNTSRPFLPDQRVDIARKGRSLAVAEVISETTDETWRYLRVRVTDNLDERIRIGTMALRRPVDVVGENGWERWAYEQLGRLRVSVLL